MFGAWSLGFGVSVSTRSLRVHFRQIPVIARHDRSARDLFNVATRANPGRSQWRQTFFNLTIETVVAPRTAGVINAHRLVRLDLASYRLRRRKSDFAERHKNVGMNFAADINAFRIRQLCIAVCFAVFVSLSHIWATDLHGSNTDD